MSKTTKTQPTPIKTAYSFLLKTLKLFETEIIEYSFELDSCEIIGEVFEVVISYYTKNESFNSDNSNGFEHPNVKNYRKLTLDQKGSLVKMTSKID